MAKEDQGVLIIPFAGGQLRVYFNAAGEPTLVVADTIGPDGVVHYGTAVGNTPSEVAVLIARYAPHLAPAMQPAGDDDPGGATTGNPTAPQDPVPGDRSTWQRLYEWWKYDTPLTLQPDVNVSGGARPGVKEMLDTMREENRLHGSGSLQIPKLEVGAQRALIDLPPGDDGSIPETPADAPPDGGAQPDQPSPGERTGRDPLDFNAASPVEARAWDMFHAGGRARLPAGSGAAGGAGSDSGGPGNGGNPSGSGDAEPADPPPVFDPIPQPAPPRASGGTAGSGTAGSGTAGSGTGRASPLPENSEPAGSVSGAIGHDYDGDGDVDAWESPDGTLTPDNEPDQLAADPPEESPPDDPDDGEAPGVSRSEDPTGDRRPPTAEDLERAMAFQNWLRAARAPIDPPDGGGYVDSAGGPSRFGRPDVAQPSRFEQARRPAEPPPAPAPGANQGGYTDPGPDSASPTPDGPEAAIPSAPVPTTEPQPGQQRPSETVPPDEPLGKTADVELSFPQPVRASLLAPVLQFAGDPIGPSATSDSATPLQDPARGSFGRRPPPQTHASATDRLIREELPARGALRDTENAALGAAELEGGTAGTDGQTAPVTFVEPMTALPDDDPDTG